MADVLVIDSTHNQTADNIILDAHYNLARETNAAIIVEYTQHDHIYQTDAAITVEYTEYDHIRQTNAAIIAEYTDDSVRLTNAANIIEYEYEAQTRLTNAAVMVEYDYNTTIGIIQSTVHSQTADNIILTQHQLLELLPVPEYLLDENGEYILDENGNRIVAEGSPNSGTIHSQTAENIIVTYHSGTPPLEVQSTSHAQTSDNIILTFYPGLITDNSVHYQTSDNLNLTSLPPAPRLQNQNTRHYQTSQTITLIAHNPGLLSPQNTIHQHSAGRVRIGALEINNASHNQTSSSVILVQYRLAKDAYHAQTAQNINLSQNYVLPVNNSVHAQTSTTIVIYIIIINNLFGWKKVPMGIGINGPGIR